MNKKEIARMFVESFRTKITSIVTPSSSEREKDDTCIDLKGNAGEVVFRNHASYEKGKFTSDFKAFGKKIAETYGVEFSTIYRRNMSGCSNFYYRYDPIQIIEIDGIKFRMGRRMMNMPHAILDGVSHRYYIDIYDLELVAEIQKLNDERIAAEEAEKQRQHPANEEEARRKCVEMIEKLSTFVDAKELSDNAIRRIADAYFDVCIML